MVGASSNATDYPGMQTNLAGQTVLVTGASGGIGSAMARAFVAEGARVALHYKKGRANAERLAEELNAEIFHADLTKESETRRLFESAARRFGRIDTLIANAGSWVERDVPIHKMSLKQ